MGVLTTKFPCIKAWTKVFAIGNLGVFVIKGYQKRK
jgi:hypothetical protein